MDEDKERIVIALLTKLELAFDRELMPSQKAIYLEGLANLQPEAISLAVDSCIKSEIKFPPVAKIREYANIYRMPVKQLPQFSYKDLHPNSELGKECIKNITELFDGKISKREYLITSQRICDTLGQNSEWINEQWKF